MLASQGLIVTGVPVTLGSSGAWSSLSVIYAGSQRWKAAFKSSPELACSPLGSTLCSAGAADDVEKFGQLVLATSPRVYSSADPASTGGLVLVAPPGDQRPCSSCTGFAVAAAARAAIASALRVNATDVEPLSPTDLLYCSKGAPQTCNGGWTLVDVLKQLTERHIAPEACLPYEPIKLESYDKPECGPGCVTPGAPPQHKLASQGAALSRFDIMSDFRAFFEDPKNADRAVAIIGYNLEEGYWLVQNSWGARWGADGRFKVAFNTCSLATAPDIYGIAWTSSKRSGAWPPAGLTPSSKCTSGFEYKAQANDYLSGVALRYKVPLQRLLLDNTARVTDLDAPLTGKRLLLCGMQSPLERSAEAIKAAVKAGTFGVSWGGLWFLSIYNHGVLDALQVAMCAACAGIVAEKAVRFLDTMRMACDARDHCRGKMDSAVRIAFEEVAFRDDAHTRCSNVCYVGLTTYGEGSGKFFDTAQFRSREDFKNAIIASMFVPEFSTGEDAFDFRGQDVASGYLSATQPPCPPGVTFCMRVSAFRAPDIAPMADLKFAFNVMLKLSKGITRSGVGVLGAPPAKILGFAPTSDQRRAAAQAAADLGVEVAPNIFHPVPLTPDAQWTEMAAIPPDGDMSEFLLRLGQKDGEAWLRAMGIQKPAGARPLFVMPPAAPAAPAAAGGAAPARPARAAAPPPAAAAGALAAKAPGRRLLR
ncbi:MAG: hypothetical protein J3K34DRAFT_515697 [Monoraphidium minutum]|nr:MAG: hypothetical protein J3K34DRAFT_515697 [Monoraphidium minutum]